MTVRNAEVHEGWNVHENWIINFLQTKRDDFVWAENRSTKDPYKVRDWYETF